MPAHAYGIRELLYRGRKVLVYRAHQPTSGESVILKVLQDDHQTPKDLSRLRREHALCSGLDIPAVRPSLSVTRLGGAAALCLADVGAEPLSAVLARERLSISRLLPIFTQLAGALAELHAKQVIHKDINPTNLLIHPESGRLFVIDFDMASVVSRERPNCGSAISLEGTLGYVSPEQTGRTGQTLDHRTDLYSVGVTMYEALTGRLPFTSQDPLDLVHAHLARTPEAPVALDPRIPASLSAVTMKLLEKAPEARYRSALGLKADLERLTEGCGASGFELGQNDPSIRLSIPERLYGRTQASAELLETFRRVERGQTALVLISGPSGSGKTSLVQELATSILKSRATLVSGKFEPAQRGAPYDALVRAFRAFIRERLDEAAAEVAAVRARLRAALGGNARVVVDVIPELERLIGPQEPVAEVGPKEATLRFRQAFRALVRAAAYEGRPLVLFMDDLQWADAATLELLIDLARDRESRRVLVIGAHRPATAEPSSPLALAELEQRGDPVLRVALGPMEETHVRELVADTLSMSTQEVAPLAALVHAKTGGNPFFVRQFLVTLYRERLIDLDLAARRWTYDLSAIRATPMTDNVVHLLTDRLAQLGPDTADALEKAAHLGGTFELGTLARVLGRSVRECARCLAPALDEALLVPLGGAYRSLEVAFEDPDEAADELSRKVQYAFAHDRIREAAEHRVPLEARAAIHLQIGEVLWPELEEDESSDRRFEVLGHMNAAESLVTRVERRIQLALLNLAAGRRARSAAAHPMAARLFRMGLRFLGPDPWTKDHALAHALHLASAEAEYQLGAPEVAETLLRSATSHAASPSDIAEIQERRCRAYVLAGRLSEGVEAALAGLEALDLPLPRAPTREDAVHEIDQARAQLSRSSISELLRLDEVSERRIELALRLLSSMSDAVYLVRPQLFPFVLARQCLLSANHGLAASSSLAFLNYAIVAHAMFDRAARGQQFSELALAIVDRFPTHGFALKTRVMYYGAAAHWYERIDLSNRELRALHRLGIESGDVLNASYALLFLFMNAFFSGENLDDLREVLSAALPGVEETKNPVLIAGFLQNIQLLERLTCRSQDLATLTRDEAQEERAAIPGTASAACLHQVKRLVPMYLAGDYQSALELADRAAPDMANACMGMFAIAHHTLFVGLTAAALLPSSPPHQRRSLLQRVSGSLDTMRRHAELCPDNFLHQEALLEAEEARSRGERADVVVERYARAMRLAEQAGFNNHQAIASERLARYLVERGEITLAVGPLLAARQAYERWSVRPKLRALDAEFPEIARLASKRGTHAATRAESSELSSSDIDFPTIIKASQALSGELSVEKLLAKLMSLALENAGARRGALVVRDPEDDELHLEASAAVDATPLVEVKRAPISDAILSTAALEAVLRSKKPLVVHDSVREGPLKHDARVLEHQVRSVLCMPILVHGEMRAALYLENELIPNAFTDDRVEVLSVLCAQMAISIENAGLYARLARFNEELEAKVAERTRELNEAQARIVRLEKAATEVQMAAGFAHEMRNALGSAKLLLSGVVAPETPPGTPASLSLADGPRSSPPPGRAHTSPSIPAICSDLIRDLFLEMKRRVDAATLEAVVPSLRLLNRNLELLDQTLHGSIHSVERSLRITHSIMDYARAGRSRPVSDPCSLARLVAGIVEESRKDFDAQQICASTDVPDGLALFGAEADLYAIFKNLIQNARDAVLEMPRGHSRAIQIHARSDGRGMIVASVADSGIGIREEHKDKIFDAFFSTKPNTGTGLGLAMVQRLVELHGGTVRVESRPGAGARFELRLPGGELDRKVSFGLSRVLGGGEA